MITDVLNTFADDVALNTGGAGTYTIGDQIDLLAEGRDVGVNLGLDQLYVVIVGGSVAADSSTDTATAAFSIVTADNAALSTNPVTLAATAAIAQASITQGALLAVLPLPMGTKYKRYFGIRQTTAGEAFTAGKVQAFLTPTPPVRHQYAQATGAKLSAS